MLLNKEYKVSSNFGFLFVNPLGNSFACGSAQLAFPSLLLHPTSFVLIVRATISQVPQLPGISSWFSSKVCICSCPVVEAPRALFQATWALRTAGCTEQLVPINQEHWSSTHIPELLTCQAAHSSACVTGSISIHSFPGWSYGRTTNPTYFRVQGSTAKILHTCSIQLQEFLYSETQMRSFLSLKIYFHLKTFSFSIELEPLTPNAMNTT